jgi:hypothetical protein
LLCPRDRELILGNGRFVGLKLSLLSLGLLVGASFCWSVLSCCVAAV